MMKRFVISALTIIVSLGTVAGAAHATQVRPGHDAADINRDGQVTLTEVKNYNRDQRQS